MLAGVGPFAIERGLVSAIGEETCVRIYNVNTRSRIDAVVQTPSGSVEYAGTQTIDGVPGSAAPIVLSFSNIVGSKCGRLFPSGAASDMIDGVAVTLIDVAMPMMMIAAGSLGLGGYETDTLTADRERAALIERLRLEAGRRMGLGDVSGLVIPKVGILAAPRSGGVISSRYLTPHRLHAAHAVTGGICVAACALIDGTVGALLADRAAVHDDAMRIEHPSGHLDLRLELGGTASSPDVRSAGVIRTARKILDGQVFVPAALWR
jgi:2-methylaconitate cis-trans-isomerase PrpF